jgi:hypothetical protein
MFLTNLSTKYLSIVMNDDKIFGIFFEMHICMCVSDRKFYYYFTRDKNDSSTRQVFKAWHKQLWT